MQSDEVLRATLDTAVQALFDIENLADPAQSDASQLAGKALRTIIARRMGVPEQPIEGHVSVRLEGPSAPDRRRWAKWVLAVDPRGQGGYAFEGPFLKPGFAHSLPPGAVVLECERPIDDKTSQGVVATANIVQAELGLVPAGAISASGPRWARQLVKPIMAFLDHRRTGSLIP